MSGDAASVNCNPASYLLPCPSSTYSIIIESSWRVDIIPPMTQTTVSFSPPKPTLIDGLVKTRERFISALLGVRQDKVLNDNAGSGEREANAAVAGELKQIVNAFKSAAMDMSGTHVDYRSLRDSDAYRRFQADYTPLLRSLDPARMAGRDERLAFWINLYNVLVIDAIIATNVRDSVTEGRLGLLSFFRKAAYDIGGQRMSCEDIEHGILRANRGHPYIPGPQFASADARIAWVVSPMDVRIHFALNCGSRSCPPIAVYAAADIDAQLALAARSFVHDDVLVDADGNRVYLSAIFKWHNRDFGGRSGVLAFVREHLPEEDDRRVWLDHHSDTVQLVYAAYDWVLNT